VEEGGYGLILFWFETTDPDDTVAERVDGLLSLGEQVQIFFPL
jgi:hypothetical protein